MLRARLFGQFCLVNEAGSCVELRAQKPSELLAYLLLNPGQAHRREVLANVLWSDKPTAPSKKYLRQALWQLQSACRSRRAAAGSELLLIDADHVQVNPDADLWTDVAVFESACAAVRGRAGERLDADQVRRLEEAVELCRGELLDGWYLDWVLRDRDRLQEKHLELLDKLLAYYAARGDREKGMPCAARILNLDRARETAHRELMRFYYRAGDRAAALRQYGRCAAALADELDVEPSVETIALYQEIRTDRDIRLRSDLPLAPATAPPSSKLPELVSQLQRMKELLSDLSDQVQRNLASLEGFLPLGATNGSTTARISVAKGRPRLNG